MTSRPGADELARALTPVCAEYGVDLVGVESRPGVLQVFIEGADLDTIAKVSKAVSAFLDSHDELAPVGRYELEVSSPGVERRLRSQADFARVLGSRVALRTTAQFAGERRLE